MSIAAYNTLESAREIAARLGLEKVAAATDGALQAALELAAIDLDSSMRYQGRRYDAGQEREFPRVSGELPAAWTGTLTGYWQNAACAATTNVWDWDSATGTAVVPATVKTAEVIQAESLLEGTHQKRVQAYAAGLASVGIGSMSKQFRADAAPSPLFDRARRMMEKYRLRSGSLL
jgi:hypothetical protein